VSAVTAASLVLAFLAALALAKFRFYGRTAFIVLIVVVQMVPLNALIIPLYVLLSRAGQVDRLTGVIVTYLTFVLPFCVWTLRGFMLGVPRELEEASMVDGTTRFGAFVRILLPLVAPGLVATSIFAFIQVWNEFIMAYVLLSSPEKQTLSVWLAGFTTLRGTDWGSLMAGATLTAIPVVVFFVAVHRRIAFGLTAGAVKS
jgi:N,N'-diacetylchitobiose transport system permease protein